MAFAALWDQVPPLSDFLSYFPPSGPVLQLLYLPVLHCGKHETWPEGFA